MYLRDVDDGYAVSYQVLEIGVPVLASGGERVGTVAAVIAAEEEDIFHGLLVATDDGTRFVPAQEIASLHELSVHLRIDAAAAAALGRPEHDAPVYREHADQPSWRHWTHKLTGRGDWDKTA